MVQIEMQTGDFVTGIKPGLHDSFLGRNFVVIKGKILNIKSQDVLVLYDDKNNESITLPKYRIIKYTFGGVWVKNPDFDPDKISKEESAELPDFNSFKY